MATKSQNYTEHKLNEMSKMIAPSDYSKLSELQERLDEHAENHNKHDETHYLLFEAQARIHLHLGKFDDAKRFADEAVRLYGSSYADAELLINSIESGRNSKWAASFNEQQLKNLHKEKSKVDMFLGIAIFGLIIFVPLYVGAQGTSSRQRDMIDTCVSNIEEINSSLDDAGNTVSSLNDALDNISSEASSAAGDDYDTQAYTLDQISSDADNAKSGDDYSSTSISCEQLVDTSSSE